MPPPDSIVATVVSKSPYGGSATAIWGWATSSDITAVVGLLIGVGGFGINWYYKFKQDRREAEAHHARMVQLSFGKTEEEHRSC